jgi:GNAT superfamily N-acetyltransferase
VQEASGQQPHILRDLGDGLMLRRAAPQDIEPLIAFFSEVFDPRAGENIRAIITGTWLVGDLDHFTIVEDTQTGHIVSSLTLLSKTCVYGGISFGVGQPEFVATHPDYRRRGLIRAQMDCSHRSDKARALLRALFPKQRSYIYPN